MIDIHSEHLLSMTEAAQELPGRPNLATLWRWRTKGIRGVHLETVLCGGRRFTSRQALWRFTEATTAAADGPGPVRGQTPRQRAIAIENAEQELDQMGV